MDELCFARAIGTGKARKILTVGSCQEQTCGFYKTNRQFKEGLIKEDNRVKALDVSLRGYIEDKYNREGFVRSLRKYV